MLRPPARPRVWPCCSPRLAYATPARATVTAVGTSPRPCPRQQQRWPPAAAYPPHGLRYSAPGHLPPPLRTQVARRARLFCRAPRCSTPSSPSRPSPSSPTQAITTWRLAPPPSTVCFATSVPPERDDVATDEHN